MSKINKKSNDKLLKLKKIKNSNNIFIKICQDYKVSFP